MSFLVQSQLQSTLDGVDRFDPTKNDVCHRAKTATAVLHVQSITDLHSKGQGKAARFFSLLLSKCFLLFCPGSTATSFGFSAARLPACSTFYKGTVAKQEISPRIVLRVADNIWKIYHILKSSILRLPTSTAQHSLNAPRLAPCCVERKRQRKKKKT